MSPSSLFLTLFLSTLSSAYILTHYAGPGCRSQSLGRTEVAVDPAGPPCHQEFAGTAASLIVAPNENDDDFGSVVVFFTGDDCKPSDIINFDDEGCMTGNYGSFQVWDLWKVDGLQTPVLS
ncbi:hypothetical protein EJ05DRAFT_477713 [Pseudovirgaria hyperparasitica]|uniref:Uncharacterized protein n=1 Tax=Pseudovirgaria hyperparasitica TaxID=470096 RepID=A0A6A6W107_9PEZI|nr:uncharacterized protein EJ05DRAFT_477713 [Pseudovirgaria hyperparasitica]KAF2756598.1 hypothetical protein EJ05DRAFT_477713 [Pseudovirgaria hyperparasitica]